MDTSKVYFDSEGNECSIWQMVKREPTWAAVRIQEGEKAIDEITTLRQQLAESQARVAELESIFIRQQGEYVKGPDGFDTWRDAAVSERTWRASMKPLNEAVDLARQAMDIFTGPNMNERKICAELVRLDEVYTREAQRLRQQADELEK
jgi:hypothetical protein